MNPNRPKEGKGRKRRDIYPGVDFYRLEKKKERRWGLEEKLKLETGYIESWTPN